MGLSRDNTGMKKLFLTLFGLTTLTAYATGYDRAFPYSFEYCAATQLKYQDAYFDGAVGGVGGHATIYIQGLCKDYSKAYPTVIPCYKVKDIHKNAYPHDGVGISLDSDFSNIMWVAVPGRELFYSGNVESKTAPIESDLDQLISDARRLRVFEGAKFKTDYVNRFPDDSEEYLDAAALWSTGTDIALNWGRQLRCAKTPIKEESLQKVADFLNSENEKYRADSKEYNWSFFYNNCTHLAVNAAHAAGLSKGIKTDRALPVQLFNIAVPANVFMLFADDWVLGKFNRSYVRRKREKMENGETVPLQMGSLIAFRDALPTNFMFKNEKLNGLTIPRKKIFKMFHSTERYDKRFEEPKYTELGRSLVVWEKKYIEMKESLESRGREKDLPAVDYLNSKLKEMGLLKDRALQSSNK